MSTKNLSNWTPEQLPDLTGKTYLITGGNSGIGHFLLTNLLFDLVEKVAGRIVTVSSIACHPGYAATKLQDTGPANLLNLVYKVLNPIMAQPAYNGAIPTVLAAAGNEAQAGGYYGPQCLGEARGPVGDAHIAKVAQDEHSSLRLWEMSELLVGRKWSVSQENHSLLRAHA